MWAINFWGIPYWGTRYWGKAGASSAIGTFRFSGDGGNTWSNPYDRSLGGTSFKQRTFCNRIGTFNDFMVELSGSGSYNLALTGANMDLELLRAQGRGVPLKTGPPMVLRVSYDGANTWSAGYSRSMGNTGEFKAVTAWNRPGMARDCVIEVSGIGEINIALTGANFDAEEHKG